MTDADRLIVGAVAAGLALWLLTGYKAKAKGQGGLVIDALGQMWMPGYAHPYAPGTTFDEWYA